MVQDLRYAIRMLLKRPGFTMISVVALAIGIGASTTIFSVVNAVLLRPLPYKDPGRLVIIDANYLALDMERIGASAPEFLDYRDQAQVFEQIAAFGDVDFTLTGGDGPESVRTCRVSASLFPLLGATPARGRTFSPEEEQVGRSNVVVLSDGLWRRRFGADPNIIGTTLTLEGRKCDVVGVMPDRFQFPHSGFPFGRRADLWMPIAFTEEELAHRSQYSFRVIARLQADLSFEKAQAEMDTLASRLQQQYPRSYRGPNGEDGGWKITATSLEELVVARVRPGLLILLSAVAFVLLIGCANVANLMVARGLARQKEVAVRLALGAGRARLVRQFMTESLLLALMGGGLGLLLALWGNDLLAALAPANIPRASEVSLDLRVLGFALAVTLGTGLLFGLAPAMAMTKPDLIQSLKDGSRSAGGSRRFNRLRSLLVSFEVAISVVLLIGAGLMINSFIRLLRVDPGFNPDNLLTMEIVLPESRYAELRQCGDFFTQLLARVEALPSVRSAGAITILPLSGGRRDGPVSIEGRPFDTTGKPQVANYRVISPTYFDTLGTRLVEGRWITDRDAVDRPAAALVNEALARNLFPNEDPIGKRLKLGAPRNPRPWLSIVGVVADVKHDGLDTATRPEIYVSYLQEPLPALTLVVRSASDPTVLVTAVRNEVLALDREQPIYNVRTVRQLLSASVSNRRFSMLLLGVFASVALLLAVLGVYGVIGYWVSQRTQEIGIRMALGARPQDIFRLVMRRGMILTTIGVVAGLAGAFAVTRVMSGMLFSVTASDPATFAVIALLMTGAALAASFIPARRATRVDPMIALRCE
jgi:putative ABC transport system permease protein